MTFDAILEKYRSLSFSERDKGSRFERLMQAYLLTDPQFSGLFKEIYLWYDFPFKSDFGGQDTGIDLVALTSENEFWAIQCKCVQPDAYIDKPAVDTFLSTSSRQFFVPSIPPVPAAATTKTSFSHRLWISTSNNWSANAEEALRNQFLPVSRISLFDLQQAPIDWSKLEDGIHGEQARTEKKQLRPHQKDALARVHEHFQTHDRGKLIMACGTGKTFNSLRIAENETNGEGLILFLVPSIALLGQTLREWSADAINPINPICICSDPEVSKKKTKNEDTNTFSTVDLALPASTSINQILKQFHHVLAHGNPGMTVVFSTYQSIDVIARAQQQLLSSPLSQPSPVNKTLFGIFDLIICDEAHRTTGVTLSGEDESAFTKVHDNDFLKAKKRLYMTATPRLYSDDSKSKAAQAEAFLCSMDDVDLYGEEMYRIGFGEAVEKGLLSDYKVLVLSLNDSDIPPAVQKLISDRTNEINADDASKLIGCINALSKITITGDDTIKSSDPEPMRRAVAFCESIIKSKKIRDTFNASVNAYINSLPEEIKSQTVSIVADHIDGTMSATTRDQLMNRLKSNPDEGKCHILSNVRCLCEGVDVPALDAVLFLSPKNSQIDVVQSVGRVMRKAPGKKYGYIIIPVIIPSNVKPEVALYDNERYKVVWTVLNALRAHDDRFNATVNKIDLNKARPAQILIGRTAVSFDSDGNPFFDFDTNDTSDFAKQMSQQFKDLQNFVFARMVQKVGDRRYWEQWAKSVAEIAELQIERISNMVRTGDYKDAFDKFLTGLKKNINPSITQTDAIEMLSQHIITRPVFDALFEGYSFVQNNPISVSMQSMIDLLESSAIEKDTEKLQRFYKSVKDRASGIDNAEAKQRIILELYDTFFKTAFPRMAKRLGIVYTPVPVVDFIINSVNDILQIEFGRSLSDENVNIIDPFTGTGTFITRLLQSGLIRPEDLHRKYHKEIFANELVLLAYYIAAVNIENVFHDSAQSAIYQPFNGICLTDTFQLGEADEASDMFSDQFPHNSERVMRQKTTPITVIIGNPPYSIGQESVNDNAQNQSYPKLDKRIADTYAKAGTASNKNALYDSYIKAFRWSTDRLSSGIICFVSNGAWLESSSTDGLRKYFEKEFTTIYVFNLRGNCRTSGELRQKEAGNVFGLGSRTPVAITLLIKKHKLHPDEKAFINYYDIGDYHNRDVKLNIIKDFKTFSNLPLFLLHPNKQSDWISQRSVAFSSFIEIGNRHTPDKSKFFDIVYSRGVATARDHFCWNFSSQKLENNLHTIIDFFNEQCKEYQEAIKENPIIKVEDFVSYNSSKITWNDGFKQQLKKGAILSFVKSKIYNGLYRPFCNQYLYFAHELTDRLYQMPKIFPSSIHENLIICVPGIGDTKEFSVIITDKVPDLGIQGASQCFPLYWYESTADKKEKTLFDNLTGTDEYIRHDAISDFILKEARSKYAKVPSVPNVPPSNTISKEDIFFYVYGFLHSPQYRETFAADLKKLLPRLPLVDNPADFWAFSKAGRALAELHLNYEAVPPHPAVIETSNPTAPDYLTNLLDAESSYAHYHVLKMRFPAKNQKYSIIYNSRISLQNIPPEAYQYIVNGKSAIEWIMERYQITTHPESGITNNPNHWSEETNNPRYIIDLLHSVIHLSVQTVVIVNALPKLNFESI